MSIELMMPSNHLILCHPLLLLPSVFPSIRVFSNELALHIMWPKCWNFSFSTSPSNEYSGLISFRMYQFDLIAVQRTLESLLWHHLFFGAQPSLRSNSHIYTCLLENCSSFANFDCYLRCGKQEQTRGMLGAGSDGLVRLTVHACFKLCIQQPHQP